jgi:glycosyltransferase involved in cell wall biosynthesis
MTSARKGGSPPRSQTSADGAGILSRVKTPKILAVASASDLDFRYGCTPAWWQLWKGMHEVGVDLIVTPYRGRAVESPWWRTAPNPLYAEAEGFAKVRDVAARLKGDRYIRRAEDSPEESLADKTVRNVIWRYVTPRWQRHLDDVLTRERDVDAVVVFTVPMSHFRGIPTHLRERYGVPVIFYDGDVPMSLPEFGGMDTGFNYYHGADPSEYDLVISNSEGGLERLRELGARRAEAVFWGADPELFRPHDVEKEYDVFFYGYGDKFRREWMKALIGEPSRTAPEIDFALGGRDFRGDIGSARLVGDVPFNVFARAISAARINLNVTRRSHASVFASSTARPFELAAAGAAIVSNPYEGIERWFEPGRELLVVDSAESALDAYRELLGDAAQAEGLGRRARERVLDEHTYAHRARQVLELVGISEPVRA